MTYSIERGARPGAGELHTKFEAKYDGGGSDGKKKVPTPVNLTNHAYWNLSGNRKRLVRGHGLMLRCNRYLPLGEHSVRFAEGGCSGQTASCSFGCGRESRADVPFVHNHVSE